MSNLPKGFEKLPLDERQRLISSEIREMTTGERALLFGSSEEGRLADRMIECALGVFPVPLGLIRDFPLKGKLYQIPMATEEASVLAACRLATSLVRRQGGFTARTGENMMEGQVFLKHCDAGAIKCIESGEPGLKEKLRPHWESLEKYKGGWRGLRCRQLDELKVLKVEFSLAMGDIQGANRMNRLLEAAVPLLEKLTGGSKIMAICSNRARHRITEAGFAIPLKDLALGTGREPQELGENICLASRIACYDRNRAVTHNKGIMNGITALALATGNDTRALEAAVHAYASEEGEYRALSRYEVVNDTLRGSIRLPLPLASRGGATEYHPVAAASIKLLGNPGAGELSEIAAALGLAQNLAALRALCSEGIQKGHMNLHNRRNR